MGVKLPTLAVIIPAYNEEEIIKKCVLALFEQTVKIDEIIVVNNNSADKTEEILQKLKREFPKQNLRILHEKRQGMIWARNKGFNSAKSAILGRIDADSIINENWAEIVKKIFTDPQISGATGPVIYHDMPGKKAGLYLDDKSRKVVDKITKTHTFLFGSNMAIRREAWETISADASNDIELKEKTMHEDIDLSILLAKYNLATSYCDKMIGSMSARRLEDSPRNFRKYMKRFNNTYKYHGIRDIKNQLPIAIFWSVYFPLKFTRFANKLLKKS